MGCCNQESKLSLFERVFGRRCTCNGKSCHEEKTEESKLSQLLNQIKGDLFIKYGSNPMEVLPKYEAMFTESKFTKFTDEQQIIIKNAFYGNMRVLLEQRIKESKEFIRRRNDISEEFRNKIASEINEYSAMSKYCQNHCEYINRNNEDKKTK